MAKTEVRIIYFGWGPGDDIIDTQDEIASLYDEGFVIASSGGFGVLRAGKDDEQSDGFVIMVKPPKA